MKKKTPAFVTFSLNNNNKKTNAKKMIELFRRLIETTTVRILCDYN